MPTVKDRAFSELALRLGRVDENKLRQAEATVLELEKFGIAKFIGAVLTEKKIVEESTVCEVAKELMGMSVRCRSCDGLTPLSACDTRGELKCPSCHSAVTLPEGRLPAEDLAPTPAGLRSRSALRGKGDGAMPRGAQQIVPAVRAALGPSEEAGRGRGARAATAHGREKSFQGGYDPGPLAPPEVRRYRVGELIGTSAIGRLYRITDNGIFGALKVFDPAVCSDRTRFKSWLDLMQRVQDVPRSATIKPTQFMKEGSVSYVVRPYVAPANVPLGAWLKERTEASPNQILDWVVAIVNSLVSWHSLKIVHGNLKPENVLLAEGGALLTDAGMSMLLQGLPPEDQIVRAWDSARYSAPEVLQGGEATPASDVFSTGKILEDLLEHSGVVSDRSSSEREALDRLRALLPAMTALDPAERQPSAKEVLRDLKKPAQVVAANRAASDAKRAGPPRRRSDGRNGILRLQVLGPAALVVAIAALSLQGWRWVEMRSALATGARAVEVTEEILGGEMAALTRESRQRSASPDDLKERWEALLQVCRGTGWETRVRRATTAAIADLENSTRAGLDGLLASAREKVAERRWTDAARVILETPPEAERSRGWSQVREQFRDGLYAELGMLLVPGGEVTLRTGRREETVDVPPFLVDASQVTYAAASHRGYSTPKGTDPASAVVGLSLDESRQLARLMERRLLSLAEWLRLADVLASEGEWGAYLKQKARDIGSHLEWVESGTPDALARSDYGFCVGTKRPGVPLGHPVRRWVGHGYPDVAVRLARDLVVPTTGDK